MSSELELKYSFTMPYPAERVFSNPLIKKIIEGVPRDIRIKGIYYDTADKVFAENNASLRIRYENECSVAALKTTVRKEGALALRGEWQVEAEDIASALPLLAEAGAPDFIRSVDPDSLIEIARIDFLRREVKISNGAGLSALLAYDEGEFRRGECREAFAEMELELVEGEEHALLAIGHILCSMFPLAPQPRSKLSRARNL